MARTILPEIHQSRDETRTQPTPFPNTCPACGALAHRIVNDVDVLEWNRRADYACGADYTFKSQIQNRIEKWWGVCQEGAD